MLPPLAERMRPKSLADYIGQEHLVGENGKLAPVLKNKLLPSLILWGPPGTGKTTLAYLLAGEVGKTMHSINAVSSGIKDVREIIEKAKKGGGLFQKSAPVLFIDEIHRFNKAQQDALLGAVEQGVITLIGATTENPSFEIISALLSRCQVYVLEELTKSALLGIAENAIKNDEILGRKKIILKESDALLRYSGGDARRLLNVLELVAESSAESFTITDELVEKLASGPAARYDKNGEQHYDIISAFIKSIRGSDPNAAVYWMARMLEGGEDIKFIARRMVILASEDIGNANPTALVMATNTFQAVNVVGLPEARIILSQCAIYLATSDKSNASYEAINKAQSLVREHGGLPVPLYLRNAPTKLMKELDYGKNYKYAHSHSGNFVEQDFLPEALTGTKVYEPQGNKREASIRKWLASRWHNTYDY